MEALYKLNRNPANFNFLDFLVAVKTYGATGIVLDDTRGYNRKYDAEDTAQRMASIVEPACALAGLGFRYGEPIPGAITTGYHVSAVINAWRTWGRLAKLETVKPAQTARYTVTIRNYARHVERNSNRSAWLRFAERIGAVVIEDWKDSRIHLHDRMALYAGARMNYFTAGGPLMLCVYSDYPYTAVMSNVDLGYQADHGWPRGSQVPWANANQITVWAHDSEETINALLPAERMAA